MSITPLILNRDLNIANIIYDGIDHSVIVLSQAK
jgi:hypothetical protein